MSKKIIILLIVFITLPVFVLGFFILKQSKLEVTEEFIEEFIVEEKEVKEIEIGDILYSERENILETVRLQSGSDTEATPDDWEIDIYDFYKVGTVTSGKYENGDLLLVFFTFHGPCKGPSCGKPMRLRYIKKDNVVTFLPEISHPKLFRSDALKINPFKKFGFSLEADANFTVPVLEYPKEIRGTDQRQILRTSEYFMEEDGEVDLEKLYKVFVHSVYGDIYTTKEDFSPSRSFELEKQGGTLGSGVGIEGCEDTDCFVTNEFFAFRPDGTFLRFSYNPDISAENITWTDNKKTGDRYVFYTVSGCSRQMLDYNSVVDSLLVDEHDLVVVGTTNDTGDPVYDLKDRNHKLYAEFYNTYKEYYAGPYIYPEEKREIKSFDDFIDSRPIFLWRDPFGRLIRFNNDDFLPPMACEPIIYLYPQTRQEVSITLDRIVNISRSAPEYKSGWNVIADPSGEITDLRDHRTYPYLFWEGWSLIFPVQNKGFVVRQDEVSVFLPETLPKLGLNEKEKGDFMEAWLPYFSDSPYYFITFLEQSAIDKVAPLQISPKPDTVIRILMDVKPLDYHIEAEEIEFKEAPERFGFTVIEWGGLKR